jgi:hypothetical protein
LRSNQYIYLGATDNLFVPAVLHKRQLDEIVSQVRHLLSQGSHSAYPVSKNPSFKNIIQIFYLIKIFLELIYFLEN